jgi:serine phosphatase RsbU (regulator of sigma subunit)
MKMTEQPSRILVVDDLEANRDLLARRVQRFGHLTGFADNGRVALEQLRASAWDLVLLDITMPVMDGYETLREIKADPLLAHIPVVMVSAIDEIDSVVRCIELGADDYLAKPFNPVILRARIESSLAKKHLADQKQITLRALSREMEIGQQIQRGFLPEQLPTLMGWDLAVRFKPARHVGGDFYDALQLADGRIAIAVADVCDKGVGAALYMALFRSLLRSMLLQGSPDEPADHLLKRTVGFTNDYIATEHSRDHMFATLFIGIVDIASGQLDYINAGHEAPLLGRMSKMKYEMFEPQGLAVGMMPDIRHEVRHEVIEPGDTLLVFTDGITEAIGATGQFTDERVQALVVGHDGSAENLLFELCTQLDAHTYGYDQHDDITVLCLHRQLTNAH